MLGVCMEQKLSVGGGLEICGTLTRKWNIYELYLQVEVELEECMVSVSCRKSYKP